MEPNMKGWVEELLKNNHSPSDEAAQAVKESLVKPLKDLEDLDAEILDLKNRLSELESRRGETQKRISQYRSILAPIRRIPPDVLGEIFLRCLPTMRNPIIKSTECPLLLTRICSPWRAVAISYPRLWERIYITFTDEDTVPDLESAAEMVRTGLLATTSTGWQSAPSKAAKQHTINVLRRRYEAVREWVLRSGTRPLSISLSILRTHWYYVPYRERPPSITMELLSFLATLAPRMRDLELKTSSEIYEVLEQMVTVSEMTALDSLRIEVRFPAHIEPLRKPLLLHAPHLQNLSIISGDSRIWDIDPSIRWNQLTNISCRDALTVTQTVDLLQRSSNLIHYKGVIADYTNGDIPFLYDGYIALPFLRSLSLSQYGNPRRLGNMYDRIDAPSLQLVSYTTESPPGFPQDANPGTVFPILPLLQKSTELQKLHIDVDQFIAEYFRILFDIVPTITHLVIGSLHWHRSRQEHPLIPSTSYTISGVPTRDLWGFEHLIVREHIKDDKPPLLPRLTSLVISSPKVSISDDTLIDLIKSRMTPGRTAALEQVKVVCYREREKDVDVEGELANYAKLVGSKISLELDYNQPPPPASSPVSPEFGLNPSGRSWRYRDAGEDL